MDTKIIGLILDLGWVMLGPLLVLLTFFGEGAIGVARMGENFITILCPSHADSCVEEYWGSLE